MVLKKQTSILMGFVVNVILAAFIIVIAYVIYYFGTNVETPPTIASDGWFGEGKKRPDDKRILPFKVDVPNSAIEDLKNRLRSARISYKPLEDVNDFTYGFNSLYLRQLVDYWLNKYNWRFHEDIINDLPHFKTEIEGLKIHFIHATPPQKTYKVVLPLLISHGWPGNVFEFYKIIPILLDPARYIDSSVDIAFEIVAPSIPGFGWSDAPKKSGFNAVATARIYNKLMKRLGFERYLVQGGDWGSVIASRIALYYPENVVGLHLNMALVISWKAILYKLFGIIAPNWAYVSKTFHHVPLRTNFKDFLEETGYYHIQATKPDTVGAALSDSPVGLAAYILEKFSSGTNLDHRKLPDGGLTKKFTMDELLTIVSIYWFEGNMANAMRYYKEYVGSSNRQYITVPTGYAVFPHEINRESEEVMKMMYNLTSYTEMNIGGHFAAFEEPKLLAEDIIKFVKTINLT